MHRSSDTSNQSLDEGSDRYRNYEITNVSGKTVIAIGRRTFVGDFIDRIELDMKKMNITDPIVYIWKPESIIPNQVMACLWNGTSLSNPEIERTSKSKEEFFASI